MNLVNEEGHAYWIFTVGFCSKVTVLQTGYISEMKNMGIQYRIYNTYVD